MALERAKFEILQIKLPMRKRFAIRLIARNGHRMASHTRYNSYEAALEGCAAMKRAAAEAEVPGRG